MIKNRGSCVLTLGPRLWGRSYFGTFFFSFLAGPFSFQAYGVLGTGIRSELKLQHTCSCSNAGSFNPWIKPMSWCCYAGSFNPWIEPISWRCRDAASDPLHHDRNSTEPVWKVVIYQCGWEKSVVNSVLISYSFQLEVTCINHFHNRACGEKASSILPCALKKNQIYLVNFTNEYQSLKIVKADTANPVCKSACPGKLSRWINRESSSCLSSFCGKPPYELLHSLSSINPISFS